MQSRLIAKRIRHWRYRKRTSGRVWAEQKRNKQKAALSENRTRGWSMATTKVTTTPLMLCNRLEIFITPSIKSVAGDKSYRIQSKADLSKDAKYLRTVVPHSLTRPQVVLINRMISGTSEEHLPFNFARGFNRFDKSTKAWYIEKSADLPGSLAFCACK